MHKLVDIPGVASASDVFVSVTGAQYSDKVVLVWDNYD